MVSTGAACESHCSHTGLFETEWRFGGVLCGCLYTSMDISTSYNWRPPPSLDKRCYPRKTRAKEIALCLLFAYMCQNLCNFSF